MTKHTAQPCPCGQESGGDFSLGFCFPRGRFAFAEARAADHFVLRRVVAVVGFDAVSHLLDLIPQFLIRGISLVAQVGELGFEGVHLGQEFAGLADVIVQCADVQCAESHFGIDLISGGKDALGLFEHIGWIQFFGHVNDPPFFTFPLLGHTPKICVVHSIRKSGRIVKINERFERSL
jgi:hypothetical protein